MTKHVSEGVCPWDTFMFAQQIFPLLLEWNQVCP